MWIADTSPELAWLMLVTSVETAANCWNGAKGEPTERLRFTRPDFCEKLSAMGGEPLVGLVAEEVADSLGATKRVRGVLLWPFSRSRRHSVHLSTSNVPGLRLTLRRAFGPSTSGAPVPCTAASPFPGPCAARPIAGMEVPPSGRTPTDTHHT